MQIALLGDIAFTGILSTEPEVNKDRFIELAPILSESDLVFANLEVPIKIVETKNEFKNENHFSLPEPTKELLKLLNIGCVSLANNHIYDYKMNGLKATIELLENLGIHYTGAGWKKEQCEPVIIKKNNTKIGFAAYVDKSTNPKTERFNELFINYFEIEKVKKDIETLKSKVDTIICSIHWGNDYSHYPTKNQITIAREIIDTGANLIMGHHPHTLQPFENYKNGTIFYSLGGITFGDFKRNNKIISLYRKTKTGLISTLNTDSEVFNFITTYEKKSNYIKLLKKDYRKWSKTYWRNYHLKESYKIFNTWINFKENILDRVYEYFFGYYQNPLKRLFQLSNIRKIKKLF